MLVLYWQTDIPSVINTFNQISLVVLMVLVALQALTQLLISYQWKRLAQMTDRRVTLMQMLQMNMVGSFVESITPSVKIGGEAVKIWWLKNSFNWSGIRAASLLMVQKSISGLMFLTVSFLFSAAFIGNQWKKISLQWSGELPGIFWFGRYLFILIFVVIIFKRIYQMEKMVNFRRTVSERFLEMMENVRSQWDEMNHRKKEKRSQFMLSGIIWLLYPVKMIILSKSIGLEITFVTAGAVVFLAYIAALIPILPGGIGTFEGTMVLLLTFTEVPPSQALALAIVFRTITFWLVCLISGAFTAYFQLTRATKSVVEVLN